MRVKSKALRSDGTARVFFANRLHTDNTDKTAAPRMRARFKPMPGAGTIRTVRTFNRLFARPRPFRLRPHCRSTKCATNTIPPVRRRNISAK